MSTVTGTAVVAEETLLDPYDYYALLRDHPVVESPVGYLVSRYNDILEVLQNPTVFSSNLRGDKGTQWGDEPTPEMLAALAEGLPERNTMVTSDPPEHGRFKALASKGFLPGRVRKVEESLHAVVQDLSDGFVDDGTVEFVRRFAIPYPLTVIADFLGCDRADLERLERWSDDAVAPLSGRLNDDERLRCVKSRIESQDYMIQRIRVRIANPTDDLLSDLVTSEVDGDRLEDLEVLSMALGLLVAGNESTRATLGNGMAILAQRPELAETLRADASRIPQFVEEVLRYDPPVQMLFRVAKEERAVGGTVIPKGARVAVIFASGNRDPKRFEQPATFEPSCPRQGTHLAFGHGEHHCIGAALARAELRVGFGALLDRMDDIRPARADDWFRRTASVTFRGFHELHVAFGKR